jgi:2-dehydropantoate 2-reductase
VLGAGAIGGLWSLRLAGRGIAVTLVGRDGDAASRTLALEDGDTYLSHTFPQQSAAAHGAVARLLVATKSHVTRDALTPLLPRLPAATPVVLLQNGMGVEDWLCAARPDLCVLCAITTDGVYRRERDSLVLAGRGDTVIGGARPGDDAHAEAIARELGMMAVPDIAARRWQKLAINCAINPLTALYRCRNGDLLAKPEALAAMRALCTEVAAVMTAEGLAADADALFSLAAATAQNTATNRSSMCADIEAGRSTEIRFLNGYVVDRARFHGIAVPANERMLAAVLALH